MAGLRDDKINGEEAKQFAKNYFKDFKKFDGYAPKKEGLLFGVAFGILLCLLIFIIKYSAIILDGIDYTTRMSGYGRRRHISVIIDWKDVFQVGNISMIVGIVGVVIMIALLVPLPAFCTRRFRDAGIPFALMPVLMVLIVLSLIRINMILFLLICIIINFLFMFPRSEKVKKANA